MEIVQKISLDEEVREGNLVSNKLKKIWNIELDLLLELLAVCEKHNIKIFAYSGTLLGAVRHKGFIPWDDDMDVAMLREDFDRLIEVTNEFGHPYFLQHANNDRRYFIDYARLRNSDTTGLITWNQSEEYNNGIFIDIYVLDGMVQDKKKLKNQIWKRTFLRQIIYSYNIQNIRKDWKGIRRYGLYLLHFFSRFYSYDKWIEKYNLVLAKYTHQTDKLTLMTHDWNIIHKYWCRKDDLKEIIWSEFENYKIPIPKQYDNLLTHCYGDYMKFPPVEQRGTWHENQVIYEPDMPYQQYFIERQLCGVNRNERSV